MKFKKIIPVVLIGLSNMPSHSLPHTSFIIDARDYKFSWVHGVNNNVRRIEFPDGVKYFKECKKKLNEELEVRRINIDYFSKYLQNGRLYAHDLKLILEALSDSENSNKFFNAGFLWNKESNLSKYLRKEVGSDALGIPNKVASELSINLRDLFLYASRELIQRYVSTCVNEGELQSVTAMRSLATYKLAQYFGIDQIVETKFVRLITDKKRELIGILTTEAPGVSSGAVRAMNVSVNPRLQMHLSTLQILDTITFEKDHGPGNFSFVIENGEIVEPIGFDNEGAFGKITDLKGRGLCWDVVSPTVIEKHKKNSKGECLSCDELNIPFMRKSLAKKILSTTDDDIRNVLREIISEEQIEATLSRFNTIKSSLSNTISNRSKFLLNDTEWDENTMREELSGKYGNTYFTHFLKKLGFKKTKIISQL